MKKIDLAIVYYEKEIDLLALLAKSIELYCDPNIIEKVYFINNSTYEIGGESKFNELIMPLFEKFKENVQVINASKFGINHLNAADSYIAQQALKLFFSEVTNKEYYLVLDAKNHFIKQVKYEHLFGASGKPRSHFQVHGGYLGTCLEQSCKYLDVDLDVSKPVLPTVTPYMMITSLVKELLSLINKKYKKNIYNAIKENNKITEFLLYCAFIYSKGGFENWYDIGEKPYATLFTKWPETDNDIKRVLESTNKEYVWMFSVHSKRFSQLTSEQIQFICNLWKNSKLFNSDADGRSFIKKQINEKNKHEENANTDGKVVEGRNGRLFIANDSNEVIRQHRGERLLADKQILSWKRILEFRQAYCSTKGINYYMMLIPDAHAVYKEDLPCLDNINNVRPVKQILSNLNDLSYISYPFKNMVKFKSIGEVYHPVDSHYSGFGAYVCYKSLLEQMRLNIKLLNDEDIEIFSKSTSGDLGEKFSPPKIAKFTECVVKNPLAKKVWNNEISNRGHMSLWLNTDKKKPKCLLLTDSYGWKIQRFFAESFSELFIVHSPLLETEAIEKFKPDIVITLMAERFLIYTPKDIFDQSAMSFAKEKGSKVISYDEIMLIKEKYKSDLND